MSSLRLDPPDHRAVAAWAADCAERALGTFEAARPDDARPRAALEAARAWVRGEITVGAARAAPLGAHAAAREADHDAARAAASDAGAASGPAASGTVASGPAEAGGDPPDAEAAQAVLRGGGGSVPWAPVRRHSAVSVTRAT